ncbi:hypothetical protein AC578_6909 [Pseudocercospora eumusae]|uniref:Uncharacterized protein n=1 Tax=Pseudocercospora eumusae TaxID=321146 RepID=A0A139H2K5_9PEZI|nr:hypothetical protein AC578_6909 [Pseudocercospora eumusae]
MPVSTRRPNPQNLSGKSREEKWTPPELVSPTRTSPRSHNPPHRNRIPRHYTRPSWKRNPTSIYQKILANPEAVRDDRELPQYTELPHVPENIDREHKQVLYYNQIQNSRDRSFTTQHDSIKKDIREGQVRRTTVPAKKHEIPPERREKYETVIQDRRYDSNLIERDEWKGHGWLERARAELEFPREVDRLWEEWMLRGRRTSQQERELREREREIEREEQEARILEHVRRNMDARETGRMKRKVLVEDRVERKLIPRLERGTASWEEIEQETFAHGEIMGNADWPEPLRYIDFVPIRSIPGGVIELPGDFENPVERCWGYWFKDLHEGRHEEEEERVEHAKWYRIIVSLDFAKSCSVPVGWHKSAHLANDEYEADVSEYTLGWVFIEANDWNRTAWIRSVLEFRSASPDEGKVLTSHELEALANRFEKDLEERVLMMYRITADSHFGEHGDEDWQTERGGVAKFLVMNELGLRRVVLEEEDRRGGVERPGILAVHASLDGGRNSTQWGPGDMQAFRAAAVSDQARRELEDFQAFKAAVRAEAESQKNGVLFKGAIDLAGNFEGKGKGRAFDTAGPLSSYGRQCGKRPEVAVFVPEQPAFPDFDAAELLKRQFNQTHGKRKAKQATAEDDEEEEEL